MVKKELCQNIAEKTGLQNHEVEAVINTFIQEVKGSLSKNKPVYLRGFGTLGTKLRKAKKGRNISKSETVAIPAQYKVKFTPSKELAKVCKKIPV